MFGNLREKWSVSDDQVRPRMQLRRIHSVTGPFEPIEAFLEGEMVLDLDTKQLKARMNGELVVVSNIMVGPEDVAYAPLPDNSKAVPLVVHIPNL